MSAVVGHGELKLALLLNAVDPAIGGVLLRGQKGSAKTTLARALASLLPGSAPFVELPVGATEDRVLGSLDLRAALSGGERRLVPGLLHSAHGGVLYVDEVNLLPDHLVDVLLDVAASGVNRIEREGLSESHPSRFVLVGSMNPEEGELRPQLLDRFGLAVDVAASTDPQERALAVERRLDFDADPVGFRARFAGEEAELGGRLATASRGARTLPAPPLVLSVSAVCSDLGAEGLRADLVICRGAAALAAWEGRREASPADVARVAPLALAHRRRRSPFESPGIDRAELDESLERALGGGAGATERADPGDWGDGAAEGDSAGEGDSRGGRDSAGDGGSAGGRGSAGGQGGGGGEGGGVGGTEGPVAPIGRPGRGVPLGRGQERRPGPGAAGRGLSAVGPRGAMIADRAPEGPPSSIAVAATVRSVVTRRAAERDGELPLEPGDLREAVRQQRVANLVVLAVDASGSMGTRRRMEAAKAAVLGFLVDAYQRRDRVALVGFRGEGAEVVLRPTGSVEVAKVRLGTIRTGGRTPLAAGIEAARRVAEGAGSSLYRPVLVLVSDGRATSGPPGRDPVEAAIEAAAAVRRRRLSAVVVDAEEGPARMGLAGSVAAAMGAPLMALSELSGQALAEAGRRAGPGSSLS